jgi:hypothetical protein
MNSWIPDTFWELIALARQNREQFRTRLKQMDRDSLTRFCWTYETAAADFKYEPYINYLGSQSDDAVDEISQWIVGQGKDYYMRILDNPALIPTDIPGRDPALGYLSDAVREYRATYREPVPYPDNDFLM